MKEKGDDPVRCDWEEEREIEVGKKGEQRLLRNERVGR